MFLINMQEFSHCFFFPIHIHSSTVSPDETAGDEAAVTVMQTKAEAQVQESRNWPYMDISLLLS